MCAGGGARLCVLGQGLATEQPPFCCVPPVRPQLFSSPHLFSDSILLPLDEPLDSVSFRALTSTLKHASFLHWFLLPVALSRGSVPWLCGAVHLKLVPLLALLCRVPQCKGTVCISVLMDVRTFINLLGTFLFESEHLHSGVLSGKKTSVWLAGSSRVSLQ